MSRVTISPLGEMRSALMALTRLPLRSADPEIAGVAAFGLAGATVGLAGLVPLVALGGAVAAPAALLAVGAMAVVSGALHLDGLADTADALLAPDPATAERARKDPYLGVAGAVTLIVVLSLEITSLALLATDPGPIVAGLACVAAGACSRALAVGIGYVGRTRAAPGWGARFAARVSPAGVHLAVAGAVGVVGACAALGGWSLALGGAVGSTVGAALGAWILRARRQLDGDALGATVELSFCAIVVATAVAARWSAT